MNVLALNNRIRFTLKSNAFDSIEITEPLEWATDDQEYTRNEDYHGIFINMSNNLTFVGNAADYIDLVYNTEGILAELRLTREERHPVTDHWTLTYFGYLDMETYQKDNGRIKMKFNSGGIEAVLKTRENQMVEIDRVDTIDGNFLSELSTETVQLDSRRIFLETAWKAVSMDYHKVLRFVRGGGSVCNTLPMEIFKKSHDQAQDTNISSDGQYEEGSEYMMLINNTRRKLDNIYVNIDKIKINATIASDTNIRKSMVHIFIAKFSRNGDVYKVIPGSKIVLWETQDSQQGIPNSTINISNRQHIFTLDVGESLGLMVTMTSNAGLMFQYKLLEGNITIKENSTFPESKTKAVKPFYLANRLVEIMTNRKNIVKSDALQNEQWKDLLLTHGLWIRQFSRELDSELPENDRKFKPLTTSFSDFMTSFSAISNLGVGIERNGHNEQIVIEELGYFYNQNVTIKLPNQVKNVKRSVHVNKYYKNVEIGFEKGGEYEEAMGLDEFNVKNTYTTCISTVKNSYTQVSKYRGDSYGVEFARRKPFESYSTEDSPYDQDVFFLDCKESWAGYEVRKYSDDFDSIPTGTYSPETAFNLRLSPFNSLLRHGWVIGAGLTKYPNQKIKYSSSTGNSTLKTTYPENGEIQNTRLQRARYVPEIIEFSHKVDFDISQQLNGTTRTVDNQIIPNMYGLVEFINELGQTERGYLLSVKPNGEGKWRLLKANR
ncbi:hypothetical protein [Myroides odoratus]|uniref:hypothetical protein n=1 Tax=Myroides odoratus TaxID=256 RepID=UPI00333E469F